MIFIDPSLGSFGILGNFERGFFDFFVSFGAMRKVEYRSNFLKKVEELYDKIW